MPFGFPLSRLVVQRAALLLTAASLLAIPALAQPAAAQTFESRAGSGEGASSSAVIAELNRARTNPAGYAELLASLRPYYAADGTRSLPGEGRMRTQEGVQALDGAIRALRNTAPLPPLAASNGLARAALDHARDQARTGALGHRGSDGSSPFMRMNRHGRWQSHAGECIDYGATSARRIVMNLIIDDGVRDRGHRLNILNRDFAVAGASLASHPRYRNLCVIDFATAYVEADGRNNGGESTTYAANNNSNSQGSPAAVGGCFRRQRLRPVVDQPDGAAQHRHGRHGALSVTFSVFIPAARR